MALAYTSEQTEKVVKAYTENPTRQTVEALAAELGKSVKSIIGKLSKEGVYKREIYKSKTGEIPINKIDIVADIAGYLDVEQESLEGLEKAPKLVLKRILEALEQ